MPGFPKRRVGRTALEVTEFGLGTATLGGTRIAVSRAEAEAIVRAAWDAGVRYVDTAPYYGLGQAERAVGDALRAESRDEWVLSTKVGRLLRPSEYRIALSADETEFLERREIERREGGIVVVRERLPRNPDLGRLCVALVEIN